MIGLGKRLLRLPVRTLMIGSIVAALPGCASVERLQMPSLLAEPGWMHLPEGMVLGDVSAVEVDDLDHVWVLHRPRSLEGAERERAAPPVIHFDSAGRYLGGFGGPSEEYDWPRNEHSLAVDAKGRVWIAGSFRGAGEPADDHLLAFDRDGGFLLQVGVPGASGGNSDVANLHAPGDLFVDDSADEVYVADGYGNRRLIVLDGQTGAFKRMWGAFGMPPPSEEAPRPRRVGDPFEPVEGEGPHDFSGVHGVEMSRDGRVYVSDRNNQRIQVFDREGRYLGQTFVNRNAPSAQTASGIAFSSDPDQQYLYVADWGNDQLLVYDRRQLALLGALGAPAPGADPFNSPHLIATDSKGRIYVAEVDGRRVQRLSGP
jgi:DNA-binding beta-propeller fold protein YncE